MTDGILGGKNVLRLTNGSGALTKVEGLIGVEPPSMTIETVETTDQDSDFTKEFIAGLIDPGEISATVKYVPGEATDLLCREHAASRAKRPFEIDVNGDGGKVTVSAMGIVTSWKPDNSPINGVRTATLSIKVSGTDTQGAKVTA